MKYMGSKNRFAKDLVPIIQKYIDNMNDFKGFLVPFCGGANIEDKIKCNNKISCDIHKYLIALLKHVQENVKDLPSNISPELYYDIKNNKSNYEEWLVGFVLFCGSFGGKFENGYARGKDNKGNDRNYFSESIRNLTKQAPNLKGIDFRCCDFREIPKKEIKGYVIYNDPPISRYNKIQNW